MWSVTKDSGGLFALFGPCNLKITFTVEQIAILDVSVYGPHSGASRLRIETEDERYSFWRDYKDVRKEAEPQTKADDVAEDDESKREQKTKKIVEDLEVEDQTKRTFITTRVYFIVLECGKNDTLTLSLPDEGWFEMVKSLKVLAQDCCHECYIPKKRCKCVPKKEKKAYRMYPSPYSVQED